MAASVTTSSADETRAFGARLARALPDGAVVALVGELGSGKTTLVQGAARGLGATCDDGEADDADDATRVTSPTFVIVREHSGERALVHVDAHRLRGPQELLDLGSDEFLGRRGVAFVEWADRVEGALPQPYLRLRLSHLARGGRLFDIEGVGLGGDTLAGIALGAGQG